jgi:CUB domain
MPEGTRVRLEFTKFGFEDSATCKFDKLEIFEGRNSEGDNDEGLLGRYCGNVMPPVITSFSNIVTLRFTSDWSASEEGFHVNYKLSEFSC